MNRLYLILFFLFVIKIQAQDNRYQIKGIVTNDSIAIENIHIVNKTSKKGAVSNQFGEFTIPVKVNDTLIFSGVQFYTKELQITKQQIKSNYIIIDLLQRINTLSEIELKTHDLLGNLTIDSKNYIDTVQKANPLALNFNDIDFSVPSLSVAKQLNPNRLPDVTNPMVPVGGDILGLVSFVFKPIIHEVAKIGKNKRELKKKERNYQRNSKEAPEKIRAEFGDDFFVHQLNIPVNKIDAFIKHCKSKGIIDLYIKDKKLEITDLLIKESENFN